MRLVIVGNELATGIQTTYFDKQVVVHNSVQDIGPGRQRGVAVSIEVDMTVLVLGVDTLAVPELMDMTPAAEQDTSAG
jgi:hypothetical protein